MEFVFTPEALLLAGSIFLLRTANQTLDTVRFLMTLRGRQAIAWILGFAETTIFVITLSTVINDLNNVLNIVAYSAGFATGNYVGVLIEGRLALGHMHMRIISSKRGTAIAEKLRKEGYAVTEIPARGKDGMVSLLNISMLRKDVKKIHKIVTDVDNSAFVSTEDMRPLWRGFWGQ
jgi:uncharacterized protein YebE (UPF0316 family)